MSAKEIVDAIESVLPSRRPIEHHEPYFDNTDLDWLHFVVDDRTNENVNALSKKLSSYCGVKYAVPVSSGTAALHLILVALGIKPDEEVLIPSLTFSATARAVQLAGAIPHFIDSAFGIYSYNLVDYLEENTLPHERGRLNKKTNRIISAIIAVDLLGFPTIPLDLAETADKFGLHLIEDACQALGSEFMGRKCGSFGKAAALSFNCNKIVTGLGGGAVLTDDTDLAVLIKHYSNTARTGHPWLVEHSGLGFNYRMSSITAALICSQMDQLDFFLEKKKELHHKYMNEINLIEDTFVYHADSRFKTNYWLNCFHSKLPRDDILVEMHSRGIKGRALFTPLHTLPIFADCPRQEYMEECINTFNRTICLPSGVGLVA